MEIDLTDVYELYKIIDGGETDDGKVKIDPLVNVIPALEDVVVRAGILLTIMA